MKTLSAVVATLIAVVAPAQSLHFVSDTRVPYQIVASNTLGRITEPRIDVLRTRNDWSTYYSAQNGFFGGPVMTSLIQPDFCKEQVISVNLGGDGTFGQIPVVRSLKMWDEDTWEVVVDLFEPVKNPIPRAMPYSPYVAFRTPLGPDNFRFVFLTPEGREVIDLRSPKCYNLPRDWWRCHDGAGRGRQ